MKSKACQSNLDVFEFKEEDETLDPSSKYLAKSLLKYQFVECVASQGTNMQPREIGEIPCVNIDADEGDDSVLCTQDPAVEVLAPGIKGGKSEVDAVQAQCLKENLQSESLFSAAGNGTLSPRTVSAASSPNSGFSGSPPSNDSENVISNADEGMKEDSSSSSASDIAENGDSLNKQASDHCFGGWEMDDMNAVIVVMPDYLSFRDKYCAESQIYFSSACIKIKASPVCGEGCFTLQWAIDEIIEIESQWCGRAESALLTLHVISKDGQGTANQSGVEELKLTIVDPNWAEKQEVITSLDLRYKAIWNFALDDAVLGRQDSVHGRSSRYLPQHFFPDFNEPFDEVIYPKGDPDAVSISKRDVDLLHPETFINDTIIDFYIKYLKDKIPPEQKHRFHFFNSFFFRKLVDFDKDPSSASEGRAAFQRVRKWTRKVNLFEKDYIFIPVNYNLHWSLLVICHPGEVAKLQDEEVDKCEKVPCILHMDSIKGSHAGLKNPVQSYLWEEWKERQKETSEDIASKFLNLRFVPLELPQQENSFDCGLFLLHYVELFLEDAPLNFSPFKITKFSNFLGDNWFPPAEASIKRVRIQRLIYDLLGSDSQTCPAASVNEPKTKFPENCNENETGVELFSERCNPAETCHANSTGSRAGEGIEIELLPTSLKSSQCMNDSGLVLREFFEAGTSEGPFLDGPYRQFERMTSFDQFKSTMTPIQEEDAETGEQFVYSPHGNASFQQLSGITPEACGIPYSSDMGGGTSWNPGISIPQVQHEDIDSSSESETSLEVGVAEDSLEIENGSLNHPEETDHRRCQSVEDLHGSTESPPCPSDGMHEIFIEDSQDPNKMSCDNENGDFLPSCKEHLESPNQDIGLEENKGNESCEQPDTNDIVGESGGNSGILELDEQHVAKKPRLMLPLDGERRLTRSLSRDLHS